LPNQSSCFFYHRSSRRLRTSADYLEEISALIE
jgi:hypothetical protein